jgi:hypothetical protein
MTSIQDWLCLLQAPSCRLQLFLQSYLQLAKLLLSQMIPKTNAPQPSVGVDAG